MSTIYLPNGGRIIIHHSWTQTNEVNGNLSIRANDDAKTYYGVITPQGTVHLTDACRHTYIAPDQDNIQSASRTVIDNIKKLDHYSLAKLKKLLRFYDARSGSFKG